MIARPEIKMARIAVCTPLYGDPGAAGMSYETTAALHVMSAEMDVLCGEQSWDSADIQLCLGLTYNNSLEHARNHLVKMFLSHPRDFTHALLWDSDEKGTPRQIWTILSNMMKADRPIIGVPCPEKQYFWEKAAAAVLASKWFDLKSERDSDTAIEKLAHFIQGHACRYAPNPLKGNHELGPLDEYGCAELVKGYPTFGFALVKREVFQKMIDFYKDSLSYNYSDNADPHVGLWHPTLKNRVYRSEDCAFHDRWRSMGGRSYLYLGEGVPLDHVGRHAFRGTREALLSDWGVKV
jgi:hypothetical protein